MSSASVPAQQTSAGPLRKIEDLKFSQPFTEKLPGDERTDNNIRDVPNAFYSFSQPSPHQKTPSLLAYSESVCQLLEIDPNSVKSQEFAEIFSGNKILPDVKYYSYCYAGHQFGMWAGQLGDGRVHNFGEITNSKGERYELQLKGSGKTPYSRFADGRAVLRSSLREFVASEALHYLGIPTTRALSLVNTGRTEIRDFYYNGRAGEEPGSVVCRVSPTFIRIGNFQNPAYRGEIENIKLLADYTIDNYFPQRKTSSGSNGNGQIHNNESDPQQTRDYLGFFKDVIALNAKMVAGWQSVGFVHGVLNTDNTSILGLTIDYGPYGFMDTFDPAYTSNLDDLHGDSRYCYQNQTAIIKWNVVQLGNALLMGNLIEKESAQSAVNGYDEVLHTEFRNLYKKKLGLTIVDYDKDFVQTLLKYMYEDEADYNNFFRALSFVSINDDLQQIPDQTKQTFRKDMNEERKTLWQQLFKRYREQLKSQDLDEQERKDIQNQSNPIYIPRQHYLQNAIDRAEVGDTKELNDLLSAISDPFTERREYERFSKYPELNQVKPGVQCLTCSS